MYGHELCWGTAFNCGYPLSPKYFQELTVAHSLTQHDWSGMEGLSTCCSEMLGISIKKRLRTDDEKIICSEFR